jgi:hypothetical protein
VSADVLPLRRPQERLAELEAVIERGQRSSIETGKALREIKADDLQRSRYAYPTFEDYCRRKWGMSKRMVNYLISAAEVVDNLGTRVPRLPGSEWVVRPLASLQPAQQVRAWNLACEQHTNPTMRQVAATVQQLFPKPTKPKAPEKPEHFLNLALHEGMAQVAADLARALTVEQLIELRGLISTRIAQS